MNTEQKVALWKEIHPDRIVITEPREEGEYVSVSEYIRKRHEQDLLKDAQADALYATSLHKIINRGDIEVLCQGGRLFIDWNKYKNFVFMRYRQMPKTKGKTAKNTK